MITFFNNMAKSWVAKLILGLLLASMVLFWGLGGLTNLSSLENEAITVGKTSLSPYQLAKAFDANRQNFIKLTGGQYISPAVAIQNGMLEQTINKEIADLVRLQIADELGLIASNEAIKKYVENNPAFQDILGKFDKNYFYAYLAQTGMSETQLAHALEKELAFKHLTETIQELGYNPNALVALSYRYKNEKRDARALKIVADNIIISDTPTEEELNDYYEAYSENFMKPEMRHIKLIALAPDKMAQFITIDAEEINERYQSSKEEYNTPEERDVYQMFFTTKEDADKVFAKVNAQNFNTIAQDELHQKNEETHFGFTRKDQLMEEIADTVFNAQKGTITSPVASQTGWHIFFVKDIKQAKTADENEVKAKIKQSLINEQAYEKQAEISRQLEDILGEGKSLTEAGAELGLSVMDIPSVDMGGKDAQGNDIDAINQDLVQEVYTLSKGDTTSLIEMGNGYIIAQVEEIDPVAVKPFASVKEEIKALWKAEKQKALFNDVVADLLTQAQNGTDLSALKTSKWGTFELLSAKDMTRDNGLSDLARIRNTIFKQAQGSADTTTTIENEQAYISVVDKITSVDETKDVLGFNVAKENEKVTTGVNMSLEVFDDYTKEFGVKINQKIIDKTFAGYKTQD